jgi:predicted RNA binding protein YcfA (HicA-like mRNA interferase family)
MTKVRSLNYERVVRALGRDGWVVVRQHGSHLRFQKHTPNETLKLVVPARPSRVHSISYLEPRSPNCRRIRATIVTQSNCRRTRRPSVTSWLPGGPLQRRVRLPAG